MLLNFILAPAPAQLGQARLPPTQEEIDDVFHIDWALGTGSLDSSAYLNFLLVRSSLCPECALADDVAGCMRRLRLVRLRSRPRAARARRSRQGHGGRRGGDGGRDDGGGGSSDGGSSDDGGPPPPRSGAPRVLDHGGRP